MLPCHNTELMDWSAVSCFERPGLSGQVGLWQSQHGGSWQSLVDWHGGIVGVYSLLVVFLFGGFLVPGLCGDRSSVLC